MSKVHKEKLHIAVIIVGWNMDYRLELLEGMYEAADLYHCSLHVYTCMGGVKENHPFSKGEYDIFNLPDYTLYDGIVFISNTVFAESEVQRLSLKFSTLNIPVICTDGRMKDFGFMGTDNYVAMKCLMEHMVKVHHYTNFKMLAGPENNRESNLRIQAFTDVLTDNGIPVGKNDIYNANYTMTGALDALHSFLKENDHLPDAFICANDLMALVVCWELQNLGYRVPADVAVTGFDNISQTKVSHPSITSIGRAKKLMGKEAVSLLVQHITGETENIDFYIPYELCIRESCGCNKKPNISFDYFSAKLFNNDIEKHLMNQLAMAMEEELISNRTYDEFISSIRSHVPTRFIHKFFVCLNSSVVEMLSGESGEIDQLLNFERENIQYDRYFTIPVAYSNGKYNSYEKMEFTDILRLLDADDGSQENEHEDVAYFMPLHFREKCFGFMGFAGSRANITDDFIGNYVKKIANSLEQLRIRRVESLTINKLEDLYESDPMTGLYNRFGYRKCISSLVSRYESSNDSIMVQFFDMDELKAINDAHGHDVGNKAIMIVANCMKQVYSSEGLVRYGGDEFIALGVNLTDAMIQEKNKKFQELLLVEAAKNNFEHPISVSMGYYIAKHPEKADAEMWIKRADEAMYKAKDRKKSIVRS